MIAVYYGNELFHYGIKGQKWGDRNGPPYPLSGEDYSKAEKKHMYRTNTTTSRKKHVDSIISKGTSLATLSYNKDRTKNVDMFYAAYTYRDKHQYNSLFNKKITTIEKDENGNEISKTCYKYQINNKTQNDIKVASEDSGADAFLKLYSENRDFCNFVKDPKRMESLFVEEKYKFKGYRDAKKALDDIRKENPPEEEDLRTVYRMFNYVIPSDQSSEMEKQRAKFFSELKKNGYSALLDTNDALYGGFKAESPIIVINPSVVVLSEIKDIKTTDKAFSDLVFIGMKTMGIESKRR